MFLLKLLLYNSILKGDPLKYFFKKAIQSFEALTSPKRYKLKILQQKRNVMTYVYICSEGKSQRQTEEIAIEKYLLFLIKYAISH